MEHWIEFIAARYNYWIVIVLMMTGLYVVFARGNLVKKIVGLNVFQTSVFIFYITIGKIAGGTAPIYVGGELDHGGGAGAGHGNPADGGNAQGHVPLHDAPGALDAPAQPIGESDPVEGLHSKIENISADVATNDLKAALDDLEPADGGETNVSLHDDAGKIANDTLANLQKPDAATFDVAGGAAPEAVDHTADIANALGDAGHGLGEVIYTNPLPHVLILTAIVVGVATTAVGLALAVRIREAYGSIEEDELEALDNVAEFGETGAAAAGSAA